MKRLNKRPMPPRFGRKLSPKQLELASHICLDCGYIYSKPCVSSNQAACVFSGPHMWRSVAHSRQ